MSILDDSLAQYPEPNYGDDDDITPPRTPDYRCNDDNLNDLVIFGESEENDAESRPHHHNEDHGTLRFQRARQNNKGRTARQNKPFRSEA